MEFYCLQNEVYFDKNALLTWTLSIMLRMRHKVLLHVWLYDFVHRITETSYDYLVSLRHCSVTYSYYQDYTDRTKTFVFWPVKDMHLRGGHLNLEKNAKNFRPKNHFSASEKSCSMLNEINCRYLHYS